MQLKLCLFCFIVCLVETSPVSLGTLQFDNLDTNLDDLAYEVEEEDIDDFSRLLDAADEYADTADSKSKNNVKISDFKKKNAAKKGQNHKHNIQDLKKFFKAAGVHDQGSYDDDDVYAVAEGVAAQAVGIKGNEDKTYRKGTKTRGFHRVHHKDEYKKDKVFYEDDETKGSIKKVGAKGHGTKVAAGAGTSKGHFHHDRSKGVFGKRGYLDKGFSKKDFSGYSDSQGFDGSFLNESK